jgi:hypothetical protein
MLADSVGLALLVVLETLTPAERLAFVLHDMFAVPFAEIAPIVGRSTQATKMLASRARHRVRAAEVADRDVALQREVVDAFLAASRNGDFAALLDLLDPDVTLRADSAAAAPGMATRLRGVRQVARQALAFSHRGQGCPERIRQRPSGDPSDTSRASRHGPHVHDRQRKDRRDRRDCKRGAARPTHHRTCPLATWCRSRVAAVNTTTPSWPVVSPRRCWAPATHTRAGVSGHPELKLAALIRNAAVNTARATSSPAKGANATCETTPAVQIPLAPTSCSCPLVRVGPRMRRVKNTAAADMPKARA